MKKELNLTTTLLFFIGMMGIIFYSMIFLKVEPHIPLFSCLLLVVLLARFSGFEWAVLEKGIINGIAIGIKPILILSLVGMLIGIWMMSGTVPTLLYYGFQVISPEWYTLSALFIAIIVSTFTGSSFTTIGTVGVALMGIGIGLGVHPGLAAGAVICGACFGDKMSPLSDTTNFAPGIAEVDLFLHIRHMLWTTLPSLLVTILIFVLLGQHFESTQNLQDIDYAKNILQTSFNISLFTLLSPLLVVFLAMRRFPTIPTLIFGLFSGIVTAFIMQNNIILTDIFNVLQHGFVLESGNSLVDGIVSRGGLQSMMWSISLIMIALGLGGVIREIGLIDVLIKGLTAKLQKRGHLISLTAFSSIGVNLLTGEQYLSILLPGQTFKPFFEKQQLHLKNLSRTLEDAGTLVNPLIPWGVSGAFFASTLGIAVIDYLPYVFFLYLSPIMTILLGYLGIGVPNASTKQ
ncbi:Na+/H+ antiporter NhaC [Bacillus taeanensis]|uniref:Na+/H+ antiporter NhaC n=1 Tax=Bacillus taeanensis TaxID=273032 RepID=A0A366XZJ6_9BACI|nr:Na+/H+ antiporter NhaC [Bacillus taeanensis]RBW70555.1 Na+/H+ antiporter NhaC [Bacillus taeanensis]